MVRLRVVRAAAAVAHQLSAARLLIVSLEMAAMVRLPQLLDHP